MDSELFALEERIEQFVALCENLRGENQDLRTRLVGIESENKRLNGKIDEACARLESLMERIPEQ
jgi:cell division protein ZapB